MLVSQAMKHAAELKTLPASHVADTDAAAAAAADAQAEALDAAAAESAAATDAAAAAAATLDAATKAGTHYPRSQRFIIHHRFTIVYYI
jgi:hypothetical protein